MIELGLCVGIFFLPNIWKRCFSFEDKQPDEISIRKILIWKFFTQTEWRVGICAAGFVIVHLLIVSPYEVFKEKNKQWADATNQVARLQLQMQETSVNANGNLSADDLGAIGEIRDRKAKIFEEGDSANGLDLWDIEAITNTNEIVRDYRDKTVAEIKEKVLSNIKSRYGIDGNTDKDKILKTPTGVRCWPNAIDNAKIIHSWGMDPNGSLKDIAAEFYYLQAQVGTNIHLLDFNSVEVWMKTQSTN